jgi:serine/threonine protein kinase
MYKDNLMADQELIGQTLGGYEIRSLVALGNMNTIYQAYQPSLKRHVALRVLNEQLRSNPVYVEAFLREAELMATLEHPHILPIHDGGKEGELLYMVQRLMRGGSLKDRVETGGALPFQEVVTVTQQLANALEYIHSLGMVNGELSRANILFDEWGNPYVSNLFFANLKAGTNESLAWTYAAPERWAGQAATPASDQYAFGILVYYMLTGQKPFDASGEKLRDMHLNQPLPAPQTHRPDIPLQVNAVLNRALAKKPEDRYPTVIDFAQEFVKAVQSLPEHLFISYSRRDTAYAKQVTEYFTTNGFTVWIDSDIDYGDAWFNEIDTAIKTCAAFVVIMTPESYQSEWVQKEILLAKRYKKPIFPLLLEGDEFPILIDLQFADVKGGVMPDTHFHRRLRRTVFGDV